MIYSLSRIQRYTIGISSVDNFVFKLCYRWTALLLVVFTFIVTCRLWFGDSFSCVIENDVLPLSYVNVKCYDDGVYFVPWNLDSDRKGKLDYEPESENDKRYQSYYSWVNLLFLVHALNFYLPHLLWKSYEAGYVFRLTGGILDKQAKGDQDISYLAKQVVATIGHHRRYTSAYIFFETCNFAVSLAQTVWLIHFFRVTGIPTLPEPTTWLEFRNFYFPEEAVCQVKKFSAAGGMLKLRALCQLPLNSLYMKMFLFLRAWYILLIILCGLVVIYRIVFRVPSFRFYAVRFSIAFISLPVLKSVLRIMSYSDLFFLSRLQMVMTDFDFVQMIKEILIQVERRDLYEDTTKGSSTVMSPL